ncbi:MAG: hypothetical protein WDO70_01240 [Alphaproteobacteria bacterium]
MSILFAVMLGFAAVIGMALLACLFIVIAAERMTDDRESGELLSSWYMDVQ